MNKSQSKNPQLVSRRCVRAVYPDAEFEKALRAKFRRADLRDLARLNFYLDFNPRVDSYESITNDELDEVGSFLSDQKNKTQHSPSCESKT